MLTTIIQTCTTVTLPHDKEIHLVITITAKFD